MSLTPDPVPLVFDSLYNIDLEIIPGVLILLFLIPTLDSPNVSVSILLIVI